MKIYISLLPIIKQIQEIRELFDSRIVILFNVGLAFYAVYFLMKHMPVFGLKKNTTYQSIQSLCKIVGIVLILLSFLTGIGSGFGKGNGQGIGVGNSSGGSSAVEVITIPENLSGEVEIRIKGVHIFADDNELTIKELEEFLNKLNRDSIDICLVDNYADSLTFSEVELLIKNLGIDYSIKTV